MAFFSVIVPTYNRGERVGPTLDSVLAQTWADFELIVVDDGSTDHTVAILDAYKERVQDSRLHIIHRKNGGPTAARNTGIAAATGRYIALLDDDDLWPHWTLDAHHTAIMQHRQPALSVGYVSVVDDATHVDLDALEPAPIQVQSYHNFLALTDRPLSYHPSTWTIRSDCLCKAGGFGLEGAGFEDLDILLRLGATKGCALISEPVLALRRIHAGNLSTDEHAAWFAKGIEVVLEREREGVYPGDDSHARQRRRLICSAIRALSLGCLRAKKSHAALKLYRRSFAWQLESGRLKYLIGFPLIWLLQSVGALMSERKECA